MFLYAKIGASAACSDVAPQVRLELTTPRLTAECSAIELLRNMESGNDLSSRAVTSQVLSARRSLTSVFGMGTGGTFSPLSPETVWIRFRTLKTSYWNAAACAAFLVQSNLTFHSLLDQALDRLVLTTSRITAFTASTYQPCRLQGVLLACAMGYLFLRGASRLDAFSVYPVRTSLPCYAVGTTTVAPEVRPLRSSRTRSSSSHVSYAHDG